MYIELRWSMKNLIKLPDNPNVFIVNKIYDFKDPLYIYIPIVDKDIKLKKYVYKNNKFGNFIASISGQITSVEKVYFNNLLVNALKITNDFKENMEKKKNIKKPTTKDNLCELLDNYLLCNLKNRILEKKQIKNLIISSIDEEIYSAREFSCLANYYSQILEVIDYLLNIFNLNNSLIVTKNTDSKSIKNVKSILGTYPNIKIKLLPDKYLISYEKYLCDYLNLNKEDTLIISVNEIYDLYNIINTGKDITERLITISGDAIEKSKIIKVKLGVSFKEVIEKYINIIEDNYDIYINGYLKGDKINNIDNYIITKDIDAIVINKKEINEEKECINCGACMKICPSKINVLNCYNNQLSHKNCHGCGLCNYICPAKINLKKIVLSDNNEK